MIYVAALTTGMGTAVFVGLTSIQALSGESGVSIPSVISLGLLIAAAWLVFRAGGAFSTAMRTVREAAEFGELVKELADTVESLRRRVDDLEEPEVR